VSWVNLVGPVRIWTALGTIWLACASMMALGWQWQRRRSNAGIVDVLWAAGLGGAAISLALVGQGAAVPRAMLAVLGGLWGARLATHLWRRVDSEPEDGRYRHLRAHWQGDQRKLFGFFQFQALLVGLFSLPFLAAAWNPREGVSVWTGIGVTVWVISVLGESVADRQLARFRADPSNSGRTCRMGLWRFSRHPNYFFEWLHWMTYVALAVGSPLFGLSLIGPVLMYVFLRWVSGIPFTEAQALRNRGEDYRLYQQQTPIFFPWFPKRLTTFTEMRTGR
jgi:steroid 5-alpha reductase family enzyme